MTGSGSSEYWPRNSLAGIRRAVAQIRANHQELLDTHADIQEETQETMRTSAEILERHQQRRAELQLERDAERQST